MLMPVSMELGICVTWAFSTLDFLFPSPSTRPGMGAR